MTGKSKMVWLEQHMKNIEVDHFWMSLAMTFYCSFCVLAGVFGDTNSSEKVLLVFD